jgi:hypothetical protein
VLPSSSGDRLQLHQNVHTLFFVHTVARTIQTLPLNLKIKTYIYQYNTNQLLEYRRRANSRNAMFRLTTHTSGKAQNMCSGRKTKAILPFWIFRQRVATEICVLNNVAYRLRHRGRQGSKGLNFNRLYYLVVNACGYTYNLFLTLDALWKMFSILFSIFQCLGPYSYFLDSRTAEL